MRLSLSVALVLSSLAVAVQPSRADDLTNSLGMKFVQVAPGSCEMGQAEPAADYKMTVHPARSDDADWDERPVHRVTISGPFRLGATEVTNGQYRQFKPDHNPRGKDDEAVVGVSWTDAMGFCQWLSAKEMRTYRLPTEAEWEYACRAGTRTVFSTGDRLPGGFQKWRASDRSKDRYFTDGKLPPEYRELPSPVPLTVGQTPANAWGLFDMHGNVEEWCLDWYGPYETADQVDPVGRVDGDFRVTRGGCHSQFARLLRSANRAGRLPGTVSDKIGFRVVLADYPTTKPLPVAAPGRYAEQVSQSLAPALDVVAKPYFAGPKPYVKIPANSAGPLFSAHNHSPAIAECPNGDLLSVWYTCVDEAGSELAVAASRLRRGATEWDDASPFWDGPDVNDHAPKLWFDGTKTLYFFARGFAENVIRTSTDNGATWSKVQVVQPCAEFANVPIRTREGFLLVPHDSRATSLIISRDGGKSWTYPEVGTRKHDYRPGGKGFRLAGIHNGLVQLADGRLMAFGRFDPPELQAAFNGFTPISYSSDWGETWTYAASPFPAISSVQRPVLMRLREGALLFCSFTDQVRNWKQRKGMTFVDTSGREYVGYGLFAAVSFDEGRTWPVRKLLTPGGPDRTVNGIDRNQFTLGATMAESQGYLAASQTGDGVIQLITSKNHYAFNLAWLKQRPESGR